MVLSKSKDDIVEVSLRPRMCSPGAIELLRRVFMALEIPQEKIIENEEEGVRWVSTYFKSSLRAKKFKERLQSLRLKKVSIHLRNLYKTHWVGKWKLDFHPFALTRRLDIVPQWRKKEYRPTVRQPIYIDTITAFGTGLHETTRFMSQLIEESSGRYESFLDIGTGTGILSLVALKSGAKDVTAIDMDRHSIQVARTNMALNGHAFCRTQSIDLKKFKKKERFDFVAANLITHDLLRMKRKIISLIKREGFLAISGISLENFPRIRRGFKQLPLDCLKVKRGKEWVAILYKRRAR